MYPVATTSLQGGPNQRDEIQYIHSVYILGFEHDNCSVWGALFQEVRSRWELARRADPSPECGMLSLSLSAFEGRRVLDRICITAPSPRDPAVSSTIIECECNRVSAKAIRHSRQETSVGKERLHFIAIANRTT